MSAFIFLTTELAIWVGFPDGSEVKNLPTVWETRIQSLSQEDPLEKGMVCPLQYSCLENSMNRGGWQASPWDQKSWTRLSDLHFYFQLLDDPPCSLRVEPPLSLFPSFPTSGESG